MSLYFILNARITFKSRLITVGGIRSANWVTRSFSGAFRTSAGLFTTKVFAGNISNKCVEVIYAISKGGS